MKIYIYFPLNFLKCQHVQRTVHIYQCLSARSQDAGKETDRVYVLVEFPSNTVNKTPVVSSAVRGQPCVSMRAWHRDISDAREGAWRVHFQAKSQVQCVLE